MADGEQIDGGEHQEGNPSGGSDFTRHDAIPETYFDAQTGYKFEDIGKALTESESLRTTAAERAKDIPESADGYKIELPQDFQMPGGYRLEVDPKDPLVAGIRAFAAEKKLTQTEVNGLAAIYLKNQADQIAAQNAFDAEQTKQLGANAQQRRDAAKAWIGKTATPSQAQVLNVLLDYKDGVEFIESIIGQLKGVEMRGGSGGEQPDNQNAKLAEQAGKPGGGMAMLRAANAAKN